MKTVSENEFEAEVLNKPGLVLVDFFATWCGPCMMLAPVLEEISAAGEVEVVKVNVDENPNIAHKYQIASIPTMIYFRNGEMIAKEVGLREKDEIINKIRSLK